MENKTRKERVCADCGEVVAEWVTIGGEDFCHTCAEKWTECDECGAAVLVDYTTTAPDGRVFCESCADALLVYCERCGSVEYTDGVRRVYENSYSRHRGYGEYWCESCASRHAYWCDGCEEYYSETTAATSGGQMCDRCLEDYCWCERCDSYVHYDDWDSDEGCCDECATRGGLIRQYHNKPALHFYGAVKKQWRGVWRGIGVELEIDRDEKDSESERATAEAISDIMGEAVYFNRDGSLRNGFEIITQPHTLDAFYKIDWRAVLDACRENGYTSHDNERCGLHVHFSREMFGRDESAQGVAISKLIAFIDRHYDDILKISRRSREQASSWAASYCTATRGEAEQIGKKKGSAGRYYAVNNQNRATVEIRIMRGTLNYNSFHACVDFLVRLVINSRQIKWDDIDNASRWLRGCAPATLDYIKARGAFVEVV